MLQVVELAGLFSRLRGTAFFLCMVQSYRSAVYLLLPHRLYRFAWRAKLSFDNVLSYVIIQNRQKRFYDLGVHTTRPIRSSGKRWTGEGADNESGGKSPGEGQKAVQRTGGRVSRDDRDLVECEGVLLKKLKKAQNSAWMERKDLRDARGKSRTRAKVGE